VKFRYAISILALLSTATAAELKEETVRAWDEYVQTVNTQMQKRFTPGGPFLWSDELAGRRDQLRAGKIIVEPIDQQVPKRVPSGLIHHWIGAVFIRNTGIDQVLSVTRNYERYSEYYRPIVMDAKTICQEPSEDRFSMVLMNKSVFRKTALEGEYESRYFQLSQDRWYSVSSATRIQEIENYRQPTERKLPAGTGSGYIWRIASFTRLEQRDDGVYLEAEAIVLSRDIPGAVRWFVDPIVRRVSRNSLVTSLRQTQDAAAQPGDSRVAPSPACKDYSSRQGLN
jgi:hypothetical protein